MTTKQGIDDLVLPTSFVREVVRQAHRVFKHLPLHYATGWKMRNGQPSLGVFFDLTKKPFWGDFNPGLPRQISLVELFEGNLPAETHGIDWLTIKQIRFRHACNLTGTACLVPTSVPAGPPSDNAFLQPGQIILSEDKRTDGSIVRLMGTISAIVTVRDPTTNALEKHLLSACHVLAGDQVEMPLLSGKNRALQPRIRKNSPPYYRPVGYVSYMNATADFALAKIRSGETLRSFILRLEDYEEPREVISELNTGDVVLKSGNATGLTSGVIDYSNILINAPSTPGNYEVFHFTVRSAVDGLFRSFAADGDSGAPLVTLRRSGNKCQIHPVGVLIKTINTNPTPNQATASSTVMYFAVQLSDILFNQNNAVLYQETA